MSFAIGFLTHAKFDKKELDMNIQTIMQIPGELRCSNGFIFQWHLNSLKNKTWS